MATAAGTQILRQNSSYYNRLTLWKRDCAGTRKLSSSSEMQTKVEEWLLEEGTANVWTGFSWHRLLSDGRIILLTFSRKLILKCLRVGDDHYLQHPYQCFIHYHPVLTRHRQYMVHLSASTTKSSKRWNRLLPDLYESMPMTICLSHSTLITSAFEKCCYITLQSENQLLSKFCYACPCINN